jgi:hypothetical protein
VSKKINERTELLKSKNENEYEENMNPQVKNKLLNFHEMTTRSNYDLVTKFLQLPRFDSSNIKKLIPIRNSTLKINWVLL